MGFPLSAAVSSHRPETCSSGELETVGVIALSMCQPCESANLEGGHAASRPLCARKGYRTGVGTDNKEIQPISSLKTSPSAKETFIV